MVTTELESLFPLAIYVNASSKALEAVSRGSLPSEPRPEKKRWTTGRKLFEQAGAQGRKLPLIFAHYTALTYWAIAADIQLGKGTTRYSFTDLRPISGRNRSDLWVESSDTRLPDNFIRSYAIVRTPEFLVASQPSLAEIPLEEEPEELWAAEGELRRLLVNHRRRERRLRDSKVVQELARSGRLRCEVAGCGFDFRETYGDLGARYVQVHHARPLSDRAGPETTGLEDLALLCANCHAMIHNGNACRSLEEIAQARAAAKAHS
jgi:hypothetical protein